MEIVDKRKNVKIVTEWECNGKRRGALAYIVIPYFDSLVSLLNNLRNNDPSYHSSKLFENNLCAFQLNTVNVTYEKKV